MTVDAGFYEDFLIWFERRGVQLAQQNLLGFAVYMSDGAAALNLLVADLETIAGLFRGNIFSIAGRLVGFADKNPDPLASARTAMRAMRAKYGEVTTAAAPVAPAPVVSPASGTGSA